MVRLVDGHYLIESTWKLEYGKFELIIENKFKHKLQVFSFSHLLEFVPYQLDCHIHWWGRKVILQLKQGTASLSEQI